MVINKKIGRSTLSSICLLIVILMETAFENTPLRNYDLTYGRVAFLIEAILFIGVLVSENYTKKRLYMIFGVSLLFLSSYMILNSTLLCQMFMIAVSISVIGMNKSFEIIFKFKIIIICFVVALSLIGAIPVYYTKIEKGVGTSYGYGLGFTHPNRLASAICYAILCYVCWKHEKLKIKNITMICFVTTIIYFITKSRTTLYCILIFVILYFLNRVKLTKHITEAVVRVFGIIIVPFNIMISMVLPYFLLESIGFVQKMVYSINQLFSRRFTHIEHMFLTYPISWTGGQFDTKEMEKLFGYTVIDNGYITFLYQYGIIGLAIFCIFSVMCVVRLIKNKKYIWVVAFIVMASEGLLENVYTSIGLNLLVVFWAYNFSDMNSIRGRKNDT